MQPSPSPIEDRAVGMEALEALHNQIQILVKQDCPEEDAPLANLHEAVIASLRHQLEEVQQTLDFLRRSDQNLRLALRDADHRALEAETKLFKANERNQRLEHKLLMMAHKYQQLKAHLVHSNHALCSPLSSRRHITSPNKSAYYSPQTQRVHRVSSADSSVASHRPSSAQGTRDSVSMETCV
jgi:chromosome segregation ATPase